MKLDFFHKYAQHLPNFEKKSFKNIYFSFSNVNELYKRGNEIIFNIGVFRPRPINMVQYIQFNAIQILNLLNLGLTKV